MVYYKFRTDIGKGAKALKENINILLVLMQLVIGGAETHVVELAKELKRKGHNVIVASNGGVYVKELDEAGIKHYSVPLHNKKPQNLIISGKRLKKIIEDEHIDLVHSHARIPSFVLNRLYKKMKFPFVTTAHWVFNTKYGLKYITPWGEKVVAVSEDIKKYLMDNYKIPQNDIRVTINGIDTDKFSPQTDVSDIREEFNVSEDENVIVYVSRLDESRSLVAKQLISTVPELCKNIEKLRVIVVGGGDDFNNVETLAKATNKSVGFECITLTGPRTDINKFAALGKLFVGVSRAALEAMACEKPVVIAGNEGYIGLFDESLLDVGINTNFCCRGCVKSSSQLLLEDILKFFNMDDAQKEELGKYGRELIKREYSVSRMAEDTLRVYDWALSKKSEILISGYYGFKNNGDDALLKAIISDLNTYKESANIVVLSADPKETSCHYSVKAINRLNIFSILRHMKRADLLISGGGTLIQDKTSSKSLWYYLMIIKAALARNVKVMLYSNGIGPLEREKNKARAKNVLNRVDVITLRDKKSETELKNMGVTKPKILVTADPAFNLNCNDSETGNKILKNAGVPQDKKLLGVSIRKLGMSEAAEEKIAKAIDEAVEKYDFYPVFIPMQETKDTSISKSIISKMSQKATLLSGISTVSDMLGVVSNMYMCVGMRLHLLTYAATSSIPVIGIVCDPKISGFMDVIGQKSYCTIDETMNGELNSLIDTCVNDYDTIKLSLQDGYATFKEKAVLNAKIAMELYEKGSVDI